MIPKSKYHNEIYEDDIKAWQEKHGKKKIYLNAKAEEVHQNKELRKNVKQIRGVK